MAQRSVSVQPQSLVVGTATRERVRHRLHGRAISREIALEIDPSRDSTHLGSLCASRNNVNRRMLQ
jgi:hypothetical protein